MKILIKIFLFVFVSGNVRSFGLRVRKFFFVSLGVVKVWEGL